MTTHWSSPLRFARSRHEQALDALRVLRVEEARVFWEPFATDGALLYGLSRRGGSGPSHVVLSSHDEVLCRTWQALVSNAKELEEEVFFQSEAIEATDREEGYAAVRELWNAGERTPAMLVIVRALTGRPMGHGPLDGLTAQRPRSGTWLPPPASFTRAARALKSFAWSHVEGIETLDVQPQTSWAVFVDPPDDAPERLPLGRLKEWVALGARVVVPAQSPYGKARTSQPFVSVEEL